MPTDELPSVPPACGCPRQIHFFQGLRGRLLGAIGAATLLGLTVLAGIVVVSSTRTAREAAIRDAQQQAGLLGQRVQLRLDAAMGTARDLSLTLEGKGDYYLLPKRNNRETATEPYLYNAGGKDVMMTSLAVPIHDATGRFVGVAGADVALSFISEVLAVSSTVLAVLLGVTWWLARGLSRPIARLAETLDLSSVEAARAGEAGAGFAVVADEVRSLAQRSAAAAKETTVTIETTLQRSARGFEMSGRVSTALEGIAAKIRQVDEIAGGLSRATAEQGQGVRQIADALQAMDKVTQENAAAAEETASASEEMNAQADTLKQAVAELLTIVNGARPVAATPARAPLPPRAERKKIPAKPAAVPARVPGFSAAGTR